MTEPSTSRFTVTRPGRIVIDFNPIRVHLVDWVVQVNNSCDTLCSSCNLPEAFLRDQFPNLYAELTTMGQTIPDFKGLSVTSSWLCAFKPAPEKQYKVGQRFTNLSNTTLSKGSVGQVYILANVDGFDLALIDITTGHRWSDPFSTATPFVATESEIRNQAKYFTALPPN